MFKRIDAWVRNIVWEESQRASTHFKPLSQPDQTAKLVQLILDLHDKKWSHQTDSYLRELNIDPTKYWKKYGNFAPTPKVKSRENKGKKDT